MFCSKCGQQSAEGATFCPGCGNALGGENVKGVNAQQVVQPVQQPVYTSPMGMPPMAQKKNHTVRNVLLIVGGVFVVALIGILLLANSIGNMVGDLVNAPKGVSKIIMASEVNELTQVPTKATEVFSQTSPQINCTFIVNAKEGAAVKVEWYYLPDNLLFNTTDAKTTMPIQQLNFNLTPPEQGWPAGKYEAKIYIENEYQNTADFEVK